MFSLTFHYFTCTVSASLLLKEQTFSIAKSAIQIWIADFVAVI